MISGFQSLRQAMAPMARLEPTTEESLYSLFSGPPNSGHGPHMKNSGLNSKHGLFMIPGAELGDKDKVGTVESH
ncbi:hypothetical protein PoB_002706000 [Plakobranchus ocellatus]|uniref:Uncharacterized protein n=1 Tax=Plakobranchus ocellatus TaxID=259542 RepID=A0AAV4A0X2_9GAST|nr:hypothetical protein PoB_002706000 [Plakobranchus ocellatus]